MGQFVALVWVKIVNPKSKIGNRVEDEVYYLHGDNLGSTSLTTDSDGTKVSEVRYHPYGLERWTAGESPTDFGFTSQRNEKSFGLLDYKARYYSPVLGRFVSPDTIVPEPTSSGGFNRYRYVRNNPVKYTDPSGHKECLDGNCDWVELPTGKVVWQGEGGNPSEEGVWNCNGSLASCHGTADASGYKQFKQLDHYEDIDAEEFRDLVITIKKDLETQDKTIAGDARNTVNVQLGRGYGGRSGYDTPLWNAEQFDATICIDGHGCWKRTEVNYIAQGMWGAAAGSSLDTTLVAPELWNQVRYGHSAELGETYWTEYGWKVWWVLEQSNETPEVLPQVKMENGR